MVRFEGNQSKCWDEKEVLVDYEWVKEKVDVTQLLLKVQLICYGQLKMEKFKVRESFVNIDDTLKSHKKTNILVKVLFLFLTRKPEEKI